MINKTFVNMKLNWQPHLPSWNDAQIYQFKENCTIEAEDLLHFMDNFDHGLFHEMIEDGTLDGVPYKDLVEAFRLYYRQNRKDGKADKLIKGKTFDNEVVRPSSDMLQEVFAMPPESFCEWFISYLELFKNN